MVLHTIDIFYMILYITNQDNYMPCNECWHTYSFTAGIFILCIIQTQTLLLVAIVDVGTNELVNQPHLQREESLVGWQGPIAQSPQCAGVDASDSYQTPELVLLPFPA